MSSTNPANQCDRERAKAVLSGAVHTDYYVVAGQLYAIAEELESQAARIGNK